MTRWFWRLVFRWTLALSRYAAAKVGPIPVTSPTPAQTLNVLDAIAKGAEAPFQVHHTALEGGRAVYGFESGARARDFYLGATFTGRWEFKDAAGNVRGTKVLLS